MKNRMLETLPADELRAIYRITDELSAVITRDFASFGEFDPVRFGPAALTNVVQNPSLPLPALRTLTHLTLWIFTVDDFIDQGRWSPQEVLERTHSYEKIAAGDLSVEEVSDQLGYILSGIMNKLRESPMYERLHVSFLDAFDRMLRGMLWEASLHKAHATWDEYMAHAVFSIGVPTYIIATWLVQSDTMNTLHQGTLLRMVRLSATAIRLANDLRTFEKERQEGNYNALVLLLADVDASSMSWEESYRDAAERLQSMITKLLMDLERSCIGSDPYSVAIKRVTEFSVALYEHHDFHLISHAQMNLE